MMIKTRVAKRRFYWYELLPWVFLGVALLITYWVWAGERKLETDEKGRVFEQQFHDTSSHLLSQLELFEQSLYSIRKLFHSSAFVTEEEFSRFGVGILHSKFSAGLHQIGFAKYIDFNREETYSELEVATLNSVATLKNQSQSLYAPIIYEINLQTTTPHSALLFDVFSNKHLKAQMEAAALQDELLISGRVDAKFSEMDYFSMILPVYDYGRNDDGKTLNAAWNSTVDGWVYFNLNVAVVFHRALGMVSEAGIRYSLYDMASGEPATLIYESTLDKNDAFLFSTEKTIDLHGQKWKLSAYSLPDFEKGINHRSSTRIGLLGFFGSFTLSGVLFLLMSRLRTLDSLKRVRKRLQFSDERWRFAVEGAGDGVWDWDLKTQKITYSKNWKRMLGYDENCEDDNIKPWRKLVHPEDRALVLDAYRVTLERDGDGDEDEEHSFECRLQSVDGSWKWVRARSMVVSRDAKGWPLRIVGTHTDLSQLKESEEIVWQHVNFDMLTGLPNRSMLNSRLEQAIEKSKWKGTAVALMCLDLDGFSEINDTLGLEQGDLLLQAVAKRLEKSVDRHEDVARYSGDGFAILVSEIEAGELSYLDTQAQNIQAAMTEPFELESIKVFISASIGIAVYPNDADSLNELVNIANQAMYESNAKGGNCVTYFTTEMQEKAHHRMTLSNDLRSALSKNQLFIEYQPIVDLTTGDVCKAEALLRWQHPEQGLISPVEFIPIAESTRLINEIGAWVLKQSINQCLQWRKTIHDQFQISVNKSPVQFADNNNHENIDWFESGSENPSRGSAIVIEITEGLLLDATGKVQARMETYKNNGVQVALDDFGTGYSSLAYLQKFNIDYLKIDKSFVKNLEIDVNNRVLCRTIIVMAHGLGIKVIAEGIETKEQRDILLDAGCDYGQGFYFSKALLVPQFEDYVQNSN